MHEEKEVTTTPQSNSEPNLKTLINRFENAVHQAARDDYVDGGSYKAADRRAQAVTDARQALMDAYSRASASTAPVVDDLVAMFAELRECFTASTQNTEDPLERLRLKGMAEAYKNAAERCRIFPARRRNDGTLYVPAASPEVQVSPDVDQCTATCTDFMYHCKEPHRCVRDAGHPFDPAYSNEIHHFVTHMMPVRPRAVSTVQASVPLRNLENSIAFIAYNQAIEDALAAIRAESQGGGYWAATYINAIARKCSPHVYVNRVQASVSTEGETCPACKHTVALDPRRRCTVSLRDAGGGLVHCGRKCAVHITATIVAPVDLCTCNDLTDVQRAVGEHYDDCPVARGRNQQ